VNTEPLIVSVEPVDVAPSANTLSELKAMIKVDDSSATTGNSSLGNSPTKNSMRSGGSPCRPLPQVFRFGQKTDVVPFASGITL
jgi:hypothetical protein